MEDSMPFAVTLVPGDGTGPEITEATRRVLEATGVRFEWEVHQAGAEMLEKHGTVLPDDVIESIKQTKVALKGPITTPIGKGSRRANVTLRKKLDLYANLRPAKTYPGLRSRYEKIDLVIVRENTEDLYSGIEFQRGTAEYEEIIEAISRTTGNRLDPNSAISIKYISVMATRRIVRFAFEYARLNKVNPMAMMFSGVMMLRYLREKHAADRLEKAIAQVIAEGKNVTYDLKPRPDDPTAVGTSQVADAVIEKLQKL